ncbi:hypothetical protein [Tautonia sociabilis]|uniref:Uncharacterized protein n=1 Tax=Tautonia sociabilis TaxID=2080755 RepID=A0A432MKZ4_9BACT|nr:hypothetical protein [Tautonia sociabilis]RUL87877.1 hypothetical protein TsocGM_10110 [Tautonia sociabilis]
MSGFRRGIASKSDLDQTRGAGENRSEGLWSFGRGALRSESSRIRVGAVVLAAVLAPGLASGQEFEVPEPPSLGLPDLPRPSPAAEERSDPEPLPDPAPDRPALEPTRQEMAALVEGFEGDRVSWRQETADAPIRMQAHERAADAAFEGDRGERFRFVAGLGSGVYVSYPLPRVPISRELRASVYVRSDRPGVQLLGRVVLPNDLDPETGQPFFVNIQGTIYEEPGRWRRLELTDLPEAVERQARILRIKTNQRVQLDGAYLDRLVLNLYGGAGESEVLVDSLRIEPVPADLIEGGRAAGGRVDFASDLGAGPLADGEVGVPEPRAAEGEGLIAGGRARFHRNRLELLDEPQRAYFPWVPTIIDAPGASVEELRRFGFDVFAIRPGTSSREVERAADAGFLLMPMLGDPLLGPADASRAASAAASYPRKDAVVFWHLGEQLGGDDLPDRRRETLSRIRQAAEALEDAGGPSSPLATGDVAGDYALYASRLGLDLMGVHGTPWGSQQQLRHYYHYLIARRDLTGLANPEALFWTWIPASAPPELQRAIYGDDPPPPWGRPQLQPVHIRLATVAALAAGYRGIGYRADAELTRASGRARLIELQLLNAEIDLFQEILARGIGTIHRYKLTLPPDEETGRPIDRNYNRNTPRKLDEPSEAWETLCVGFPTPDRRGTLLLAANFGFDGQWIPPQLANKELRLTVPGHTNVSAWEVSLGGVRHLERERAPGGVEIRLTDFGPTSWILLTPDLELVDRLRQSIASWAPKAAELAIEQAELLLRSTVETHSQLVLDGLDVEGSDQLLRLAEEQFEAARAGLARGEAEEAFANARRVSRPLRILMNEHYKRSRDDLIEATSFAHDPDVKVLLTPVSAPPLMSFNTLPQLELFWTSTIRSYPFGRNLLPSGEFEETDPQAFVEEGWTSVGYEVPGLRGTIDIQPDAAENARGSRAMLRLRVRTEEGQNVDELPPVQDRIAVGIRTPPIRVRRHEFLRISALVKMPDQQAPGSGGGVIVRDSIGGELMQFRDYEGIPEWRRVVLYRRAPEDGELTVTLGLAATVGEAYFDDVRIERAEQPSGTVPGPALGASPAVATPRPPATAVPEASEVGRRPGAGGEAVPRR